MSDAQLLHIFADIANGRGQHGGFLRSFAEAVIRADPPNFAMLRPAMKALIEKYSLDRYLDTFQVGA